MIGVGTEFGGGSFGCNDTCWIISEISESSEFDGRGEVLMGLGVPNNPEPPIEGRARFRGVWRVCGGVTGSDSSSIVFLM